MIQLETHLKYEKPLRNLQLQEARLARRREKELAELRQLQQERKEREQQQHLEALEAAAKLYLTAKQNNETFDPAANGFVFSTAEIEQHLARTAARNTSQLAPSGASNVTAKAA